MAGAGTEELEARQAITDVIHRYCRSMDRIDAALGYTVWHADGTADYGPLFKGTGREFIDWVCEFHRGIDGHFHFVANITIDVEGEKAASETYVNVALLMREDGKRIIRTGRGRYLDRWSRRAGRWAIDHRHYVLDFYFDQPVEPTMGWGSRDRADPSYAVLFRTGAI